RSGQLQRNRRSHPCCDGHSSAAPFVGCAFAWCDGGWGFPLGDPGKSQTTTCSGYLSEVDNPSNGIVIDSAFGWLDSETTRWTRGSRFSLAKLVRKAILQI